MSLNNSHDSFLEKLVNSVKELYVDVKLKYKCENPEEVSKKNELEKIKDVNVFNLIEYIRESIDIYVTIKLDQARNSNENTNNKEKAFEENEEEVYENMIKKLEADVRNHIKIEYELKLQNEYLESKLEDYQNVCSEMEQLQNKLDSYQRLLMSPDYLEMNKKENEILILRAENSNLKSSIAATEKSLEILSLRFLDYKTEKEKILFENQELINKLSKKLNDLSAINNKNSMEKNKNFQINIIEDSSLVENSANSLSEKNENQSKNSTNFSKSRTNCTSNRDGKSSDKRAAALSSRISSYESKNTFVVFNSETKGTSSERKIPAYDYTPIRGNEDLNSQNAKIELSHENVFEQSLESEKTPGVQSSRYIANPYVFEKLNNNLKPKQMQKEKYEDSYNNNVHNIKRSSSVYEFKSIDNCDRNCFANNNNPNAQISEASKAEPPLSKSDIKDKNDKTKILIEETSKGLVASQIYQKNNPNSNSLNFTNFNHILKPTDLNKTPLSGKSNYTARTNINNNNIIINNKYEAPQKPITNLNMIFKFKTILNEEASEKINKSVKIDAKKIIRNPSTNYISNSSNINQIKKKLNFNTTLKSGNSTAKSKGKNITNNNNNNNNANNTIECKNFDTLKYSINQLKDFLNPNFQRNNSKSKSRSKGKMGNLGVNGRK